MEQGQGKEGIAQIHQALTDWQATGAEMARPRFLALLAEAYRKVGQAEEGLAVLAEALALVDKTGERYNEAELHRLKGELTLKQFKVQGSKFKVEESPESKVQGSKSSKTNSQILNPNSSAAADAEAYFLKAIEEAQKQQAKSLELRATMSLARLWQQQGKTKQAHKKLAKIYHWFTEGFDTKDLQEAKALLEEFGGIVRRE